jgi:hypothetical protein
VLLNRIVTKKEIHCGDCRRDWVVQWRNEGKASSVLSNGGHSSTFDEIWTENPIKRPLNLKAISMSFNLRY